MSRDVEDGMITRARGLLAEARSEADVHRRWGLVADAQATLGDLAINLRSRPATEALRGVAEAAGLEARLAAEETPE